MSYAIIGFGAVGRALGRAFVRLVDALRHLPAHTPATDPDIKGGRRVIFLSSDDDKAVGQVWRLVEQLGFAPVALGKLAEGALLVDFIKVKQQFANKRCLTASLSRRRTLSVSPAKESVHVRSN